MADNDADFVLRFDNNVVEHLGLKLYQNQPTRVIAEVVSNSWDAAALQVNVNTQMDGDGRWVAVMDDGHGMPKSDLTSAFLVIGRNKRAESSIRMSRKQMGRKGIGKLAPFGIARLIDVVTAGYPAEDENIQKSELQVTWLRLNLGDVLRQGAKGDYQCQVVYSGSELTDLPLTEDLTGQVAKWVELISRSARRPTGTIVTTQCNQ